MSDTEDSIVEYSQVFVTKKFQCKYQYCNQRYSSSQARSRHYRKHHQSEVPKKYPSVNNSSNTTYINTYSSSSEVIGLVSSTTRPAPPSQLTNNANLREAIYLIQSLFDRENPETAIALIKKSKIVIDSAVEMRYEKYLFVIRKKYSFCSDVMTKVYNNESQKNRQSKEAIKEKDKETRNLMFLANKLTEYEQLRSVLGLVFNANEETIKFLETFAQTLCMSIAHVKQFSEAVNIDLRRSKLLRRALNEITSDEINNMRDDFSDLFDGSPHADSPLNMDYLNNSDNESGMCLLARLYIRS